MAYIGTAAWTPQKTHSFHDKLWFLSLYLNLVPNVVMTLNAWVAVAVLSNT